MNTTGKAPARPLLPALGRGFTGRCPACGKGGILEGYIAPFARCTSCGEDLRHYQTADFAPYLVTFMTGLIFTPLTVAIAVRMPDNPYVPWVLLGSAVAFTLMLLPRMKGAAIALLWSLDAPN
ncbi:MAG: DUF983 domain-containing protein [Alphaproteobacteria bacterium]|nr:DUF983 domain-containing protein [Alphaproteobacteria bacterium]